MVSISHYFQWSITNQLSWLPKCDRSQAPGQERPLLSWFLWSSITAWRAAEHPAGGVGGGRDISWFPDQILAFVLLCALPGGPWGSELKLWIGLVQGPGRPHCTQVNFGGLAQDISHDLWNCLYAKTISKFQELFKNIFASLISKLTFFLF